MGDVTVSIIGQNILINGNPFELKTVFKMGQQQGITFDEHFWKKVYCGDVNKDGCPMDILKRTVISWDLADKISAAEVKKMSSDMTDSLIDNQLIYKGEILRLKKYKTEFPENLKTQFDSAFQECVRVYVNKDCGLDPAVFMVAGKCFKSCNVASDVIDPHSAKTDDCHTKFPENNHTLVLDHTVFDYLQYPRTCRLAATTRNGGGIYNLDFRITDINGTETQITHEYFLGNNTKKTELKIGDVNIENNAKLCIAKYSGDTLQSLIQRIFQFFSISIQHVHINNEFVVSTCDSIVALRSYALNGSYIEITDDETKEKITQVFIFRPNLANLDTLQTIFDAEKIKIAAEYSDFEVLIRGINHNQPGQNFNNIYICGSNTTYKFSNDFYNLILLDIVRIRAAILAIPFDANNQNGGISIRTLRTFKINDFLKTNGPNGQYYCITLATKYTKGNFGNIGIAENTLFVKLNGKKTSTSFFEFATSRYNQSLRHGGNIRGGVNPANIMQPPDPMDLNSMLNYYFDMDFYKNNHIVKTMFKDGDKDGDADRSNKNIDLHKQFLDDFKIEFLKKVSPSNINYKLLFFDCFSDVINSFGILDLDKPKLRYYSEDAIRYLIERYLIILKSGITKSSRYKIIIKFNKSRAKSNNTRGTSATRGTSSRHQKENQMQQFVEKSKSRVRNARQIELAKRRELTSGDSKPSGSKTRKIRP
jgi:hypothetical protein